MRNLLLIPLLITFHFPLCAGTESSESDEPRPAAQGDRYPCKTNPKHRAFDFWVGNWDVSYQGQRAGENEIKRILGDCVLFENWQGARGSSGKSFNFYDRAQNHWRQIWVDDSGGVIEFTGEVRRGVMYYTATTHNPPNGSEIRHKLTFTPNDDGSVRQLWEQSTDGGERWQTVFDGHYVRK